MRPVFGIRFSVFLLLLLAACEPTLDDYKPEPNIVCILKTDRPDLLVMAGMSAGYDDSITNPLKWNGVSGVAITVAVDGNRHAPVEVLDTIGYYRASGLNVRPGSACTLRARFPDGRNVYGFTRIPDSLFITSVTTDTFRYVNPYFPETIPMFRAIWEWTRPRGARSLKQYRYGCYALGPDTFDWREQNNSRSPDTMLFPLQLVWFDTLTAEPETLPLVSLRLQVCALDTNYAEYEAYWGFSRQRNYMRLDGGLGVFGSACIAETTLLLGR